jgi:thiol-disulfide isomerase/thioredoxin
MTEALFWVSYFGLWVLTLTLLAAVFFLYRYHGQIFLNSAEGRSNQGPALERSIPPQSVKDLQGDELVLGGITKVKQFVFFASVKCGPCSHALPALDAFAKAHKAQMQTTLVCRGNNKEVANFTKVLSSEIRVVADPKWNIGGKLRVSTTPFAFILDEHKIVRAKGMPVDQEGFEWFLDQILKYEERDRPMAPVALSRASQSL